MKEELLNIIEVAKNGDENAFDRLLRESQQIIYYSCLKTVNNEQDAMDLTQEIFLKIYKNLSSLKNNETYFSWLKIVIANTCKNHFSRRNKDILLNEDEYEDIVFNEPERDTGTIPHEALENKATEDIMMSIFAKLPEAQRLCIIMFYYDEMSIKEIASALSISENTVKSRLSYAKKSIETEVRKQENENGLKLYGAAPLFLLKSLFSKEAQSIPAPDNMNFPEISKNLVSKETKNKVLNKITEKISKMSLAQKIISVVCAAAVVCVPTALIVNKTADKKSIETGVSVSNKELNSSEKVVTKYLQATINQDFSVMYDCCTYSDTEFVNKNTYTEYKKSSTPSNIESFEIIKDDSKTKENPNVISVNINPDSDTTLPTIQYFTVKNISDTQKPVYKIVTDEGLYKDYKITAPLGASVYIDGIKLEDKYIEETEQNTPGKKGYEYSYNRYSIPAMFYGNHTAKAESKFMSSIEKPIDFNQKTTDLLKFDISENFKSESGEILKSATKKLLENGFSKTGSYQDLIPEFKYSINPAIESLRETYEKAYNSEQINSETGYKNYKLKGDSDLSFEVTYGTISVKVKQSYEYDYFFRMASLTSYHQSGFAEFTYYLAKKSDGWEIIGVNIYF